MDHSEKNMIARAEVAVWEKAADVRSSPYALRYHIAAPSGWINDPNGLVKFDGRYHAFYQHYPYAPVWGPMHWGHVSSADLVHWRHEPIALAPDQPYEKGCFSGSAVEDDGTLVLIYTAHDDDCPIKETQCIARSHDGGKTYVKSPLNPVVPVYPDGCSADFRDPKVWKQDALWHMVVGTSHGGRGCTALYTGSDLEHWTYRGIMCESDGSQGNMWECPNYCRVDGQDLLIVSPMEMPGHKNIAIFGKFDSAAGRMAQTHFQELDLGEDFYAAQVLYDGERTLMIGWMDMWGKPHPTEKDHWAGALTLPRELKVRGGKLLQTPPKELEQLRKEMLIVSADPKSLETIHSDCLEINLLLDGAENTFSVSDADGALLNVCIRPDAVRFSLPSGRTVSSPLTEKGTQSLRVFVDRCSIECFVNDGESVFTQRIYPKDNTLNYHLEGTALRIRAWSLDKAFEVPSC